MLVSDLLQLTGLTWLAVELTISVSHQCSVENRKEENGIEVFLTFMINLYLSAARETYNHCTFVQNFHSIPFSSFEFCTYTRVKWV